MSPINHFLIGLASFFAIIGLFVVVINDQMSFKSWRKRIGSESMHVETL